MVKSRTINDLVLLLINLFFETDVLHRMLEFLLSQLSWISLLFSHSRVTFLVSHDFLSVWLIIKLSSSWKSNFSLFILIKGCSSLI